MSKPIFEQPAGYRFRADGVQMSLDWRANFGAEKTVALQKAQFAPAQKAAALIDQYVPFDTGTLKNSVNQASKFDEGLLVYNTPYARRQFYLHPEGECLHGENGLRGSYWEILLRPVMVFRRKMRLKLWRNMILSLTGSR